MVQIPALRKNVTGALTASNQYLTLPTDWLADYSLAVLLPTTIVNYSLIPTALLSAAVGTDPAKTLFRDTLVGGRPLGDITNDGLVNSQDALEYLRWINGAQPNPTYTAYIENVFNPYLLANPVQYQAYLTTINDYKYMLNKDVNFIREAFPFPAVSGTPTHYAIFDANTLIVGPTPNSGYAVELHYFYYPESIVTANNTWLGDNFDSVLLYGSLLEAAAFMKSEADTITNYTNRYNEAMAQLKQLGDGKNRQDAYRSGQARYPVT